MTTAWRLSIPLITLSLCLATGCTRPGFCDIDDPSCAADGGTGDPPPVGVMSQEQAAAQLGQLHAALEDASVDGLSEEECQDFGARYQALYERDPSRLEARFNVGAVHERCGEGEAAAAIYTELAQKGDARALNNLGVMAWERGEREEAFELFQRAVEADRKHAIEARNNLAMALRERYVQELEEADFTLAKRELENVLAVDTSNRVAYENLARLYYDRGRLEDPSFLILAGLVVTQGLRVLEDKGSQSADLHNLRGLLWMEDGDPIHALRAFKRAVVIDEGHVDANRNIALVAIRFRDYQTAELSLERVKDSPELVRDAAVWNALGVAKRGLRKYDAAEGAYRHALKTDVDDPRPWYNLGILAQEHLSSGEGVDDGEKLIAVYSISRGYYEKFIAGAGGEPKLATAVKDAQDRIVIIDDTIETLDKMKALEEEIARIDAEAAEVERQRRQRLRNMEGSGERVDGTGELPVGDGPPTELGSS